MNKHEYSGMGTLAVHGCGSSNALQAHSMPIFATSAFTFDSAEQGMHRFSGSEPGYIYSRFGNPTTAAAAGIVAAMESFQVENADHTPLKLKAYLHSSGQSALTTMFLANLRAGDSILAGQSLYGGTHEFLTEMLPRFNISPAFDDFRDMNRLEEILKSNRKIKLIHIETPGNPTLECIDIQGVCAVAKRSGVTVTVDNTLATPYLQQPFRYGADFVFHSTTKFLNGHGNAVGGVLIGKDDEHMNKVVYNTHKRFGGCASPFDAFLLIQGIKTLTLRMEKHCANASEVADFLAGHAAVSVVNFNGLPHHPGYAISSRQMRHAGAVLSFELKGGMQAAVRFINSLNVCVRAVSLGTTDTLISHPASMSHAGMSSEARLASGISDGLIRMSVGLEDAADILNDLSQALKKAG